MEELIFVSENKMAWSSKARENFRAFLIGLKKDVSWYILLLYVKTDRDRLWLCRKQMNVD